jgi:ABC-2 type transport system ATP-binding protein
MAMVKIENLSKSYGGKRVLNGLSLQVEQGRFFALLGPNGAGKTTALRILTGLCRPNQGRTSLNRISLKTDPLGYKRQFGLVPQSANLEPELTVRENLEVQGRLFSLPRRKRRQRLEELLEFAELGGHSRKKAGQLSGGMQKRLLLARAIMHDPPILFLDEPTSGLDPEFRRNMWGFLRHVQGGSRTILMTTHSTEEAELLADHIGIIVDGELKKQGAPANLLSLLPAWAVDAVREGNSNAVYFGTESQANQHAAKMRHPCLVRKTNLEDVYLKLTGGRNC